MKKSLFDEIGGTEAIVAAVDIFYDKVLSDPMLVHFFDQLPMDKQTTKMISFMAWAFGGPSEYKGRDLRTAHKQLVDKIGLSDEHFKLVALHLYDTLVQLDVPAHLIDQALEIVENTKDEVLDR